MATTSLLVIFTSILLLSTIDKSNASRILKGNLAQAYELKTGDFSIKIDTFGATILSVVIPDSHGKLGDIVLGYDGFRQYLNDTTYFGALVGRVANRVGKARFVLDGKPHRLFKNDKQNSLHGGHRGFSQVHWTVKEINHGKSPYIKLYYHSFDGEQGFPGDVDVYVTYKITPDYTLSVSMEAKPVNKATPINLAQHTYWNLENEGSGTILSHKVQIFGSKITPVDDQLIPTGELKDIKGTAYDFLEAQEVGSRIKEVKGGYDMNYVLDAPLENGLRKVAIVEGNGGKGRKMELWSNQPGVQFYSGNFLDNEKGKNGHVYPQYGGLALETQGFPNSVNQNNFPSQIVRPGQVYRHEMHYKFSI